MNRVLDAIKAPLLSARRTVLTAPRKLGRMRTLYIGDQRSFIGSGTRPELTMAPRRRSLSRPYTVAVPERDERGLLVARNVEVVSERQYVLTREAGPRDTVYAYFPRERPFARMDDHFPSHSLYSVRLDSVFGSLGYAHGVYYHDLVEYFFQAHLLLERNIRDVPLLWRDMPKGAARTLIDIFTRAGLTFVCVPARLCALFAERFYCLPALESRIAELPANATPPLYDSFRRYRDFLLAQLGAVAAPRSSGQRLIYATRRGAAAPRVPRNNDQVEGWFRAQGFEVVDFGALPFAEQVSITREAAVIAGIHGANLTNIMFMAPGCRVIELMPRYKIDDDAYARLSQIFGLRYERLVLGNNAQFIPLSWLADSVLPTLRANAATPGGPALNVKRG